VGNPFDATLPAVRWDRLFADLETQLEAAGYGELDAQVAEQTRRELAATSLEGRLRAAGGRVIELFVVGIGTITGEARRVGCGWLLLEVPGSAPALIATRFVSGVRDLPVAAREVPRAGASGEEAELTHVLRVLTRDRTATAVVLADGTVLTGTIDRVGTDYVDLAEHALDEPRRATAIRGTRTLPLSVVAGFRPRLE
jgi:hypothetical protein